MTNRELYGNLPQLSSKITERRLRLAGHSVRHPEEIASQLILWEPAHGRSSRGRQRLIFVANLRTDTGIQDSNKIKTVMKDRTLWRYFVNVVRSGERPK